MKAEIKILKVEGVHRASVPEPGLVVTNDLELPPIDKMHSISIYRRDKQDCPFARGNWMTDIVFTDGTMLAIKLPLKMEEQAVFDYLKPLLERMKLNESLQ